ncbi:Permease family protein [uncultured archaeon]|nr:Permease family protein [uncultured archaeon]
MNISKQDVLGGLVNAALLMYALILSPTIIAGGVGVEFFGALMTTTIIVTIIFTLANGIYANVPFAQSVYMGENAFFAFSLVGAGIPFATALGIVFWAGVLFLIISISGLRKRFGQAIPKNLSLIWGFAVAVFLLYLAFFDAGLFKANAVSGMPTLPADYKTLSVIAFFFLVILIAFLYKKLPEAIKGLAILASIILALIMAPAVFNISYPALNFGIEDPSKIVFILNFADAFNYIHLIIIFLLIELVDVTGTLKALVTPLRLENEEEVINKVMHVEGVSTAVGALIGQPTVGTYIESAGALAAGARTGMASIITAIVFIPLLFLTPFFSQLPFWLLTWATAPALAAVSGFILVKVLQEIDFKEDPGNVFLILSTFPGIFAGNLLMAFVLPMITLAGLDYFTEKKISSVNLIISLFGLVTLALYHY